MKIYSKFLLSILPLFIIGFLVTNILVYQGIKTPLRAVAEQILDVHLDEAKKVAYTHEVTLRESGMDILEPSVEGAQSDAKKALTQIEFGQQGGVFVLLGEEQILLLPRNPRSQLQQVSVATEEWVQGLQEVEAGLVRFEVDGVVYLGRYTFFEPWGWYLIAADTEETVYHIADEALNYVLLVQIALAVSIILVGGGLISRLLAPIQELSTGAERIRQGHWETRIHIQTKDELRELGEAFNSMAAELERTLRGLSQSERRYRSLFDQANDAIYLVNPVTGAIANANQKASQMVGYSNNELRQMSVQDLYPAATVITLPLLAAQGNTAEYQHRHKDGHLVPVEVNTSALDLGDQQLYLSLVRDISLRKAAEQALRRREAVLAAVSFAAEELFVHPWEQVITDVLKRLGEAADMTYVGFFVNQSPDKDQPEPFALLAEWSANSQLQLMGNPDYQAITVDKSHLHNWFVDMARGRAKYGLLRDLTPSEQTLFHPHTKSFAVFPILVRGKFWGTLAFSDNRTERPWHPPELDALSTAARLLTVAIERQEAEDDLRWSEERFRLFTENVQEVFWLIDKAGDLVYLSPAFHTIWDVAPEEVYAQKLSWLSFVHPDDYERVSEADRNTNTHGFDETFRIVRPDGTVRWVRDRAFTLLDEQGVIFGEAGIAEDVTEQLAAEDALREAQRMESIGILAGGIAHDFNNLLTGMLGQASLSLYKLDENHPARPHLAKVIKSAERAADLTRQLLAYAGKGNLQITLLDLNQIIRDNVELLTVALPKQAHLHVALGPNLPSVMVDRGQLQQVVMNLVINAAESIRTDYGEVQITTFLSPITAEELPHCVGGIVLSPGAYVCLRVQDTGIGMDAETQQRIFDPFFSTKEHGRGLGLSATLGIIHTHHGGVVVESEPEQGTTFVVYLPAQVDPVQPTKPADLVGTDTAAPRTTVLVIDDEEPVREAVRDILELMEMNVLLAANGREGVALYSAHAAQIGLVIVDMQMPEMNGRETYAALRHINPALPIIISSGYGEVEAKHLFAAEVDLTFLQKPYDIDRFAKVVWAKLQPATP